MNVSDRWKRAAVAPAVALVVAGCSDVPAPSAPTVRPTPSGFAIAQDATPEQMAIAAAVQGFGGYFAARAAYVPTVVAEAKLGRIARTVRPSTSLTDVELTIDGVFTIRGEQMRGVVGEVANKVGRTTGWTFGTTTETCVDVIALGTTHMRLCQEIVAAVVDGGDSGSPVFRRNRGGSKVTLLGVLWGGSTDDANPEFVYSPMSGIERELGALRTF